MIVTGYRCGFQKGKSGDPLKGSYGFKVSKDDRDTLFKKEWDYIILRLEGEKIDFKVKVKKKSFWDSCTELIHNNIKLWFLKKKIIPWERNNPLKFY